MWREWADTYLAELLRLEAPQLIGSCASSACEADGQYQCLMCFNARQYCRQCITANHSQLYLHRIQYWTGHFFWKTTLAELSLRVQLGHSPGDTCCNPCTGDPKFTVIDIDGIYRINLDYCNCHTAEPRDIQLLRHRLYPATSVSPETCTTFRCLEEFQVLSFMSKASAYEYYWALSRLTDNLGINAPPVSF
ncbi:hypothetical protein BDZ89DRAFT_971750 [Hymenopellis radicata]|nr:hypothetical protein BDZ89DRAFT_971750 [Hymenopellis radicata]